MNEAKSTQSEPMELDPLDRLLTASLRKRPEVEPAIDLAKRAIERAQILDRAAQQQRRMLIVHRWRMRIVHGAAALLIGICVVVGGERLISERNSMDQMSNDDSISAANDSTTPSTGTYVLWLGAFLFICTLAGLGAESALVGDRPALVV